MNRTGSVLPGAHSKIAICARSRAWWRAAQCLAGPVRSSALSLLVNRSRADGDLAGSDAALDDVRLALGYRSPEVEGRPAVRCPGHLHTSSPPCIFTHCATPCLLPRWKSSSLPGYLGYVLALMTVSILCLARGMHRFRSRMS